jgi:CRISPR/Cas system-associated endoribonuclease Cas2
MRLLKLDPQWSVSSEDGLLKAKEIKQLQRASESLKVLRKDFEVNLTQLEEQYEKRLQDSIIAIEYQLRQEFIQSELQRSERWQALVNRQSENQLTQIKRAIKEVLASDDDNLLFIELAKASIRTTEDLAQNTVITCNPKRVPQLQACFSDSTLFPQLSLSICADSEVDIDAVRVSTAVGGYDLNFTDVLTALSQTETFPQDHEAQPS